MGMWSGGNGLYFQINQPIPPFNAFLHRSIKHMKDYTGGQNQWIDCYMFAFGEYEELITALTALRKPTSEEVRRDAA